MGFRRSDFKVNLFLSKLSNFEPQTTLLGEMLSAFSCADVVAFEVASKVELANHDQSERNRKA